MEKSPSINEMKFNEIEIKPIDFTGTFTLVPVTQNKEEIGYAVVVTDADHKPPTYASAMLLFIMITPKKRKKGYATKVVKYLQARFNKLTTHHLDSSKDGRRLMESNGFKRKGDKLIWKKEG